MEIYFNELSILPQCVNDDDARQKVYTLLETMKALRQHDFNVLRTHDDFYAEDLGNGYSFSNFINDPNVKKDIKILLRSIIKNPFIPLEDSYEAEIFVNTKFETTNHLGNIVSPEGLAASYVNALPTLSLTGCAYWENSTLYLRITDSETNESLSEDIINLFSPQSLGCIEFTEWIKSITVQIELNSFDNIVKLFPSPKYQFDQQAISDILSWLNDDKRFLIRIKKLLNDIVKNPYSGGLGKTELLSHSGKVSKRIIKKDRIIYSIANEIITIHQCRGHYNDN